jgi:hypothetical protein
VHNARFSFADLGFNRLGWEDMNALRVEPRSCDLFVAYGGKRLRRPRADPDGARHAGIGRKARMTEGQRRMTERRKGLWLLGAAISEYRVLC